MIGEIRDEPKLTTAEIANPATPRSQYQNTGPSTTTEVIDERRDVEANRDRETTREVADTRTVEGTRDIVPDQKLQNDRPGQLFPTTNSTSFVHGGTRRRSALSTSRVRRWSRPTAWLPPS